MTIHICCAIIILHNELMMFLKAAPQRLCLLLHECQFSEDTVLPLHHIADLTAFPHPTCVCLGMFDGVHLGHRELIRATVMQAQAQSLVPCAFTFDLPPAAVLSPKRQLRVLTDIARKSEIMHELGLAHVFYAHFDLKIASMPYDVFFRDILLDKLCAKHIVIGFHYRFGKDAKGDAESLKALCAEHGVSLTVIPPVTLPNGTLISSTLIRSALERGDTAAASQLLGRAKL